MTLRASRLRELENPNLSVKARAELSCEVAKHFENRGEYDDAQKALSAYWRRIGERPKVEGLEPSTAGEVLLRAGVLTVFVRLFVAIDRVVRLAVSEGRKIVSSRSLLEEIRAFEHEAIKLALENNKGSVTLAARSLGMSYQALSYMLETRHKDLLKERIPVRRRPRKQ